MKKIFGMMLVGMMLVALVGCGDTNVTQTGGGATSGTSGPSGSGTGNTTITEPGPTE